MGFWKDWYDFIRANAKRQMKRISAAIGAFCIALITAIPLGTVGFLNALYAASVVVGSLIIMSLFGKNGNGESHPTEGTENKPLD